MPDFRAPEALVGQTAPTHFDVAGLPRPIAFVLSGGASGAATQVGMLRALTEAGVFPDIVVGTSAGSLNAVIMAGHPYDGVERLTNLWREVTRERIFPGGLRQLAIVVRTRRYLCQSDGLRDLIDAHKPAVNLEDLALPIGVTATDARSGETLLLTAGCLTTALLASSAIPAIYPRVQVGDRWLIDGGIGANVPIRQAVDMGAASILVLNAGPDPTQSELPTNIARTVQHVASLLVRSQAGADLREAGGLPAIAIPLIARPEVSPFDFSHTDELIALGYDHTRQFLASRMTACAS